MTFGWQSQALYPKEGLAEDVSFTGTVASSSTLPKDCMDVRLVADQDCRIEIGESAVATATSHFLPANVVEYFRVKPGDGTAIVSVIRNTADGTLHISPTVS